MDHPPDHSVRERALLTDRSFIVQAPAGSGKTELLIRRFITLLGTVSEPEEIVAITFTRKAAAEMRERVLKALQEAQGPPPPGGHQGTQWEVAQRAWVNNQQHNWRLERHPSRLRIQTIDALCAALTRQMPWLSRFGAPLQVVEDVVELYRTAALDTVRLITSDRGSWRSAVSTLLVHLDNQVDRAVDLLTEMLRYRDRWLRYFGDSTAGDEEHLRDVLEAAWGGVVRQQLESALQAVPAQAREDMLNCAVYAAGQLTRECPEDPITAWRGAGDFVTSEPEDLPRWRGLGKLLLKENGDWRRRIDKRTGFPAGKHQPGAGMKTKMEQVIASVSSNEILREALQQVRRLPDVKYNQRQWEVLSALTQLLPLAAAQLKVLFARQGQVDFSEINLRANEALGSLDSPSDLALRLDHQISHLLVDEFQDTSLTQYRLIELLTAGWMEGDGRSLFLVGDPMQSIYRFREAEVGIFVNVQRKGIANLRPEALTLSANFRSDGKVVEWVNSTFAECFPQESDFVRGAVGFTPSQAVIAPLDSAGVSVHPLCDVDDEVEAQKVVGLIRQTWSRRPKERIGVLVRARSHLQHILPALHDAGIAYSGLDIEQLTRQPVVQDLLSLTRALTTLADRVAWLSILRAPWCGLTLNDLHALVSNRPDACVWACMSDARRVASLSLDGQRRLKRVVACLAEALANYGRLSLRRSVENVWIELGGPACIKHHEYNNARVYFQLLDAYQRRDGTGDLSGLSRAVGERWSQTETTLDPRLQIMTLHKAKGLEFDTVIIPSLHRSPPREDTRLLLWEEHMLKTGRQLLLAPVSEVGSDPDPHYRHLSAVQAGKAYFETLRLIYVGCTRARRALHLTGILHGKDNGDPGTPDRHSFLHNLWHRLEAEFNRTRVRQRGLLEREQPTADCRLQRLTSDWRAPLYPRSMAAAGPRQVDQQEAIEFSWAGETARHMGVIVHSALECIARDGLAQWNEQRLVAQRIVWRGELTTLGVPADEAEQVSGQILETLCSVLSDDRARWLFAGDHTHTANEYAITCRRPGGVRNMRIDRTFVNRDGVRWIVDYKSSSHLGGDLEEFLDREQRRYRHQLDAYASALRAMEQRPIRLGLYFPLLKGWREWQYPG